MLAETRKENVPFHFVFQFSPAAIARIKATDYDERLTRNCVSTAV